jgi:hypothetical protein
MILNLEAKKAVDSSEHLRTLGAATKKRARSAACLVRQMEAHGWIQHNSDRHEGRAVFIQRNEAESRLSW